MIKFLLVLFLAATAYSSLVKNDCYLKVFNSFSSLKKVIQMEVSNQQIDQFTAILNELPKTLQLCLGEKASTSFSNELPNVCLNDLNKAAKIGLRMKNEQENQLLLAKDTIILERLFQTKLKKECPFLTDMTLNDVKDAATCMQASYRFSLIVQKLGQDIKKNDKKATVGDLDKIFTQLPSVLDTCGKSDWANEVRKYLPLNCVHAVEDLIVELAVAEHHYSHFEWLVRNYKDIEAYIAMVRMHCPIFH